MRWAGAAPTTPPRRRGPQPLCQQRRGLRACPHPPTPAEAHGPGTASTAPGPQGSWRGLEASTPPWTVRGPGLGPPAGTDGRPGLPLGRGSRPRPGGPPSRKRPPPRGPPGGALASSPDRTWLPAPGLPSPARSPRAGRRRGSCSGPGCSTPPPWGCGRGSCRSRLGRRRRRQAGAPTRAPLPETRPEAATAERGASDPCPRPTRGRWAQARPRRLPARGPAELTLLRVGLSQLLNPRLREDFFSPLFQLPSISSSPPHSPGESNGKNLNVFLNRGMRDVKLDALADHPRPNPGSTRD